MCTSETRHAWLERSRQYCSELLAGIGAEPPAEARVTIGFPSTGSRGKAIGQCWPPQASRDAHVEIFISPRLDDSVEIVGVVMHELVHAAVGNECGHRGAFRKTAKKVGLTGKMTATVVGAELKKKVEAWIAKNGKYPASGLNAIRLHKKQPTRLLKVECEGCGYVARVTSKWVENLGAPICPLCEVQMVEA